VSKSHFRVHVESEVCRCLSFVSLGVTLPDVGRNIAAEPDRVAALDGEFAALGQKSLGYGSLMEWEYLLVTARKR
jgi:hypothetical protein